MKIKYKRSPIAAPGWGYFVTNIRDRPCFYLDAKLHCDWTETYRVRSYDNGVIIKWFLFDKVFATLKK